MKQNRFGRNQTILKTQPIYAPTRWTGQGQYRNPKIHRRTPEHAAPRRIHIPAAVWFVIGAVVLGTGLFWVLLGSNIFRIQNIQIVGSVNDAVRVDINSLYGANIITYSTTGMATKLKSAQPSISNLVISKGLPHTLRVGVDLRKPVIRWQSAGQVYLLDEDGTAFQYSVGQADGAAVDGLPMVIDLQNQPITQGQKLIGRQFMLFITDASGLFSGRFPIPLDHFEIGQSSFEVTLVTRDGWKAMLDTTRQVEPQLSGLQQVFEHFHENIKEYVDLRVPGRAYFK